MRKRSGSKIRHEYSWLLCGRQTGEEERELGSPLERAGAVPGRLKLGRRAGKRLNSNIFLREDKRNLLIDSSWGAGRSVKDNKEKF